MILEAWPDLEPGAVARIERFYELLVEENQRQNLTRLISPKDFVEGHLLDVRELLRADLLDFPAMDLGSGAGVPGLLAACVKPMPWVLAESEGLKAAFLDRTARELGLDHVQVISDRAENWLKRGSVRSIVSRAVGKVEKIYTWLRPCSTWNNLVLLKGPNWQNEWKEFGESKFRSELFIKKTHAYQTGDENKARLIVRLDRVPRGTKNSNNATRCL